MQYRPLTHPDLVTATRMALPGDEILLKPNLTYLGQLALPDKPAANDYITIRTEVDGPTRRLVPADTSLLAKIGAGLNATALAIENTRGWKIQLVEFLSTPNGSGECIAIQDADRITFDRILLAAGANGQRRGIRGNGTNIILMGSHVSGCWNADQDSQAFCAWDGAGPYALLNNFLEGGSENVLFGGARSKDPSRVPRNIVIHGNHFSKDVKWKGLNRGVKNLLELKQGIGASIKDNLFEHCWVQGQTGFAIVLTVRNDEGYPDPLAPWSHPWSEVADVLIQNNVIRDVVSGISIIGYDYLAPSQPSARFHILNNRVQCENKFLMLGGEMGRVVVDHNYADNGGDIVTIYRGDVWPAGEPAKRRALYACTDFTFTNNIVRHNDYGFWGEDVQGGMPAFNEHCVKWVVQNNLIAMRDSGLRGDGYEVVRNTLPASNIFRTETEVRAWMDAEKGQLLPGSPFATAGTDGLALGPIEEGVIVVPPPPPDPIPEPPPPPPAVDAVPPTGSMTVAKVGGSPNNYRVTVVADDDVAVARVDVLVNDRVVNILGEPTTGEVTFASNVKLAGKGTFSVRAVVYDHAGNRLELVKAITK